MAGNRAPLVSVVMPVYNTEKYLAEAIDSVLAQTFTDFEFIIVDDGSEDNSVEIIRAYAEGDCRIRLIQLAENAGSGAARNAGLAVARGEYIATMDSDDVCLPERLRTQLDFIQSRPHIGVVGGGLQVVDQRMTPLETRNYAEQHALIIYHMLIHGKNGLGHPATMIRRAPLLEAGGYRATIRTGQDVDLWMRLARLTRFANLPVVVLKYRRHQRAVGIEFCAQQAANAMTARRTALRRIWPDAPDAKLNRLSILAHSFSWTESIAIKRDLKRLIEQMIAGNWIEPADKPLLLAEIERRVQVESPHLYRRLRQWFRYRIVRHLSALWR